MARLEKFRGAESLAAVRSPAVVADTAKGAATQALGRQIASAASRAGQLAQRLSRRQDGLDDMAVERAVGGLQTQLAQQETEVRGAAPPGAEGLTEELLGAFDRSAAGVRETVPERLRGKLDAALPGVRAGYALRFAATEYETARQDYRAGIGDVTDRLAEAARGGPDAADRAVARLEELLKTAPLGPGERKSLLAAGGTAIREAWGRHLPPEERLALIAALDGAEAAGADPKALSLLRALPEERRRALARDARDELAVEELEAQDVLSERIGADPLAVGEDDILGNASVPNAAKAVLLDQLAAAHRDEEAGLSALDWSAQTLPADPLALAERRLADMAHRRLVAAGGDPDAVARSIFARRKLLPPGYAAGLAGALGSARPEDVAAGQERLAHLVALDAGALADGPSGEALGDAAAKWHILTRDLGRSAEAAAAALARGNDPAVRAAVAEAAPAASLAAAGILERLGRERSPGTGYA